MGCFASGPKKAGELLSSKSAIYESVDVEVGLAFKNAEGISKPEREKSPPWRSRVVWAPSGTRKLVSARAFVMEVLWSRPARGFEVWGSVGLENSQQPSGLGARGQGRTTTSL